MAKITLNTNAYDGRYYTLGWEVASQSTANNTSKINYTLKCAGGNGWYAERTLKVTLAGSTIVDKTDRVQREAGTIKTGSITVVHNANGAKSITGSIQAAVYESSVNCSASGTWNLTTIPRKLTLTTPTRGAIGTLFHTTVNGLGSGTFNYIIYVKCGTHEFQTSKITNTSFDATLTNNYADAAPNGTSVSVTFRIETFIKSSGASMGSNSYTVPFDIPASIKPTITSTAISESGTAFGSYIQNKSKIQVQVSASGVQGSTIKSCKTVVDGKTYNIPVTNGQGSVITDVIGTSGSVSIVTTATDSRGRTATKTDAINVLEYSPPKITKLETYRCNQDGTANVSGSYMAVKFSAEASNITGNTVTYKIDYKKSSEITYTQDTLSGLPFVVNDYVYTFQTDSTSSYNIKISASDNFCETVKTAMGATASKLLSFLHGGGGLAIGKVAETANLFECGFNAKFNGTLQTVGALTAPTIKTTNLNARSTQTGINVSGGALKVNNNEVLTEGYTYYHAFTVSSASQAAAGWRTFTENTFTTPELPKGLYLVNYYLSLQGASSTLNWVQLRWYDKKNSTALTQSIMTAPIISAGNPPYTVSFFINITSDTATDRVIAGYPQAYSPMAFTPQYASVYIARIGGAVTTI